MKYKVLVLMALLTAICVSGAFAADGDLFSVYNSSGNQVRITGTGELINVRKTVEVHTTSDTLTAAESGSIHLANISSGTLTFTLPTAAAGLDYTITSINGHKTSGQGTVILNPQSTDTFVACVTSDTVTTFTAGDDLDSAGVTGDSLRIIGASTKWYCTNVQGAWVDGN